MNRKLESIFETKQEASPLTDQGSASFGYCCFNKNKFLKSCV